MFGYGAPGAPLILNVMFNFEICTPMVLWFAILASVPVLLGVALRLADSCYVVFSGV